MAFAPPSIEILSGEESGSIDGFINPEPIITTRYSLDEINEALHASAETRDLSGVLLPNR